MLLSSSARNIDLTNCYHIFPRLCAWDVVTSWHLFYMHSGKTGTLFSLLLCSLWWVQIVGYVLACRSYSLIWRHWTYKMPVRYILSGVWVRLNIFYQLSIIHYMGRCVFNLPIYLVMIERIYTVSYHNQIGSMNHHPLFRVSSWNNGMRYINLHILIKI